MAIIKMAKLKLKNCRDAKILKKTPPLCDGDKKSIFVTLFNETLNV